MALPTPKGARKPAKPCANPTCANRCYSTYCPDCQHLSGSSFQNKNEPTHPWYQKKVWRGHIRNGRRVGGLRRQQLSNEPLCECKECEKREVPLPATVADHIKDWKQGSTEAERWELFTDPDNLQSMAASCHNRKTARTNK